MSDQERPHADEEMPQSPQGPVIPPRRPEDVSPADPRPADTGSDDAAEAEANSAEASPPDSSPPDPGPAEMRSADVTPADARPADTAPPGTAPAGTAQADGVTAETSPPGTGLADGGAAGTSPAHGGAAGTSPAEMSPPGTGTAGPPRIAARQGPPPSLAPRTGVPAVRPGGAPAPRRGAAPATRPAAGAPARRPAKEPSWGTVLATTVRLWAQRRVEKPWWRMFLVLVLAAIVFAAGAITITLARGTSAGRSGTGQGSAGGGGALAAVASARKQAAIWVAQQVNPDQILGCDPVMCAALQAAHIQANRLLMLGPSQPDPLGSEILLDTATLRSQFGSRLDTVYAPVSLAAFGTGVARVEVRVAAPAGGPAYLAQLAGDVAGRKLASAQMLGNADIHASPAARRQLIAGQVDTRLLVMLVTLAHSHPVDIISFGANQAGASPGVPLRSAEIAGAPGPGSIPAASVQTLRSFLSAQQPPYRPSIVAVQTAPQRTVLRVEYLAPSLLGLLGTHG